MLLARCASVVIRIRGHRPRCVRPPRIPHSLPTGILERGGFLRNPHSLPRASCANPFTHVLAQASLDSSVRKNLCGERGIRTPETLLEFTRFPGVPLQPLEHLSFVATGLQEETRPASLACRRCSS